MKTNIIIGIFVALLAVSCKKERTCNCTITTTVATSGGSVSSSSTSKYTVEKDKKKNFRRDATCFDRKEVSVNGAVTTTDEYKCTLD